MITSDSISQLTAAFSEAQAELKNPPRNKEVTVKPRKRQDGYEPPPYKFKYSTLDAILDMARPVLAKHGLSLMQTVRSENNTVIVTTRIMHKSGEWIEQELGATVEDRGLQAVGSALSYVRRYSVGPMLGIAPDEDDDGNAADGNLAEVKDRRPVTVQRGTAKASPQERAIPDTAEPEPFQVPVPINAEGTGSDWPGWCKYSLPHRLRACAKPADVNNVMAANRDSLETLKTVSPGGYDGLHALAKKIIDSMEQLP